MTAVDATHTSAPRRPRAARARARSRRPARRTSTASCPGSSSTPACCSRPATSATRSSSASSSWRSSPRILDEFFQVRVSGLRQQVRRVGRRARPTAGPPPSSWRPPGRASSSSSRELGAIYADDPAELAAEGIEIVDYARDPRAPRGAPPAVPRGDLPGPDAARGRSGPPVPVHLDAQPVDRGRPARPGDRRAPLRPGQGAADPAAPHRDRARPFVLIDQVIEANLDLLFTGMEILEHHLFRVTRNADLAIEEDEADDLLHGDRGGAPAAALRRGGPARGRAVDAGGDAPDPAARHRPRARTTATRSGACST